MTHSSVPERHETPDVFSGTAACVLWAGWPSRDD